MSPIRKVVTLIEGMHVQVETKADVDLPAYVKYKYWCITNDKVKFAAIAKAEKRIADLSACLDTAAKDNVLKTEIAQLTQDIADDREAWATFGRPEQPQ